MLQQGSTQGHFLILIYIFSVPWNKREYKCIIHFCLEYCGEYFVLNVFMYSCVFIIMEFSFIYSFEMLTLNCVIHNNNNTILWQRVR